MTTNTRQTYSDRYLRSPFTARLLFEVVSALMPLGPAKLKIHTARTRLDRDPFLMTHNWNREGVQRETLERLFGELGLETTVWIGELKRVPHARELVVEWADGATWFARLDHGFGSWYLQERRQFDHHLPAREQVQALKKIQGRVEARFGNHVTYLYLSNVEGGR